MASDDEVLARNRVILCHFDSYSTALVFARWPERSVLLPGPLPPNAQPVAAPAEPGTDHAAETVMAAAVNRAGLNPAEWVAEPAFDAWLADADGQLLRVHLLRSTAFETRDIHLGEAAACSFKPLSELRGTAPAELALLRQVFDLIISGGGRAEARR